MRIRLKLVAITTYPNGASYDAKFEPSYDWNDPADVLMAQTFPWATLTMPIINPIAGQFVLGNQYYFDISPA